MSGYLEIGRASEPAPRSDRFPFAGLPKGWFAVAFSSEIPAGAPTTLRYFGRELVAFRGESGRAYVTEAYCPHLGAHLAHGGTIEGETIRCPFHGWRFGGDGRCAHVPYAAYDGKKPPNVRLDALEAREANGLVFVFFDPEGGAPWELPVLDDEGWTPAQSVVWRGLRTHVQEVFENTVDTAHIGPVHDGRGARLLGPPERSGERMQVELEFEAPGDVAGMPGTVNDVHLRVSLSGLGCVYVETHVRNVGIHARQRIHATQVDASTIDIRGLVQVRPTGDDAFTADVARLFFHAYVEDFARDFPIWENKRYLERPGLAKGDGPIPIYRRWCEQFYGRAAAAARPPEVPLSALRKRVLGPLEAAAAWARARVERPRTDVPASSAPPASGSAPPPASSRPASEPVAASPRSKRRVASVEEYRDTLTSRFVPTASAGLDAVFQWELDGTGGDVFHAIVKDGSIAVRRGAHDHPTVALVMGADDYVRVVNGDVDGTWAFTTGRGKVRGSLSAAMKMRSIFPA